MNGHGGFGEYVTVKQSDVVRRPPVPGDVRPVIHRSNKFDEIPGAVRYQEAGHCPGKVVVTF